jgi:arylsulfatase B/arylsulfatase I/J
MDRLSSEGVRLENYYVQPICTPTRAAIFTGRYPTRHGLQIGVVTGPSGKHLPLEETLISNVFQDAGYSTHLSGKWHLGHHTWAHTPTHRGFDSHMGLLLGMQDYKTHMREETYDGFDFRHNEEVKWDAEGVDGSRIVVDYVADALDQGLAEGKPSFVMLTLQNPHTPLDNAPEESMFKYQHIEDDDRRNYFALIDQMDSFFGDLENMYMYKTRGLWNSTVLFFTGDNGAQGSRNNIESAIGCSFPYRGTKGTVFEGGVKAPAFVRASQLGIEHGGLSTKMFQ